MNVPKLRTGSGSQSGPTAAICIVAPMSMAAALGWTSANSRRRAERFAFPMMHVPPLNGLEGGATQRYHFPKRDRRDSVITRKSASARGPCFFTGSYATKKRTAAPLHRPW